MLQIPSLGYDDALRAITAITAALKAENKSAVVAVADQQGELIALLRVDGAPYASIQIAANKAWTAARERRPSDAIGHSSRTPGGGFDMTSYGDLRYTGFGGGIPIFLGTAVLGAVAVSGLTTSQDIELAERGAAAILGGL
jgi:glc operon protein GlcG